MREQSNVKSNNLSVEVTLARRIGIVFSWALLALYIYHVRKNMIASLPNVPLPMLIIILLSNSMLGLNKYKVPISVTALILAVSIFLVKNL